MQLPLTACCKKCLLMSCFQSDEFPFSPNEGGKLSAFSPGCIIRDSHGAAPEGYSLSARCRLLALTFSASVLVKNLPDDLATRLCLPGNFFSSIPHHQKEIPRDSEMPPAHMAPVHLFLSPRPVFRRCFFPLFLPCHRKKRPEISTVSSFH